MHIRNKVYLFENSLLQIRFILYWLIVHHNLIGILNMHNCSHTKYIYLVVYNK